MCRSSSVPKFSTIHKVNAVNLSGRETGSALRVVAFVLPHDKKVKTERSAKHEKKAVGKARGSQVRNPQSNCALNSLKDVSLPKGVTLDVLKWSDTLEILHEKHLPSTWFWFVRSSSAVLPDALQQFVNDIERMPSVRVFGPKQFRAQTRDESYTSSPRNTSRMHDLRERSRTPQSPRDTAPAPQVRDTSHIPNPHNISNPHMEGYFTIEEYGRMVDKSMQLYKLGHGQVDQGQLDSYGEAFAFGVDGLLINAQTWWEVGGFTGGFGARGNRRIVDDLHFDFDTAAVELCARVWLQGTESYVRVFPSLAGILVADQSCGDRDCKGRVGISRIAAFRGVIELYARARRRALFRKVLKTRLPSLEPVDIQPPSSRKTLWRTVASLRLPSGAFALAFMCVILFSFIALFAQSAGGDLFGGSLLVLEQGASAGKEVEPLGFFSSLINGVFGYINGVASLIFAPLFAQSVTAEPVALDAIWGVFAPFLGLPSLLGLGLSPMGFLWLTAPALSFLSAWISIFGGRLFLLRSRPSAALIACLWAGFPSLWISLWAGRVEGVMFHIFFPIFILGLVRMFAGRSAGFFSASLGSFVCLSFAPFMAPMLLLTKGLGAFVFLSLKREGAKSAAWGRAQGVWFWLKFIFSSLLGLLPVLVPVLYAAFSGLLARDFIKEMLRALTPNLPPYTGGVLDLGLSHIFYILIACAGLFAIWSLVQVIAYAIGGGSRYFVRMCGALIAISGVLYMLFLPSGIVFSADQRIDLWPGAFISFVGFGCIVCFMCAAPAKLRILYSTLIALVCAVLIAPSVFFGVGIFTNRDLVKSGGDFGFPSILVAANRLHASNVLWIVQKPGGGFVSQIVPASGPQLFRFRLQEGAFFKREKIVSSVLSIFDSGAFTKQEKPLPFNYIYLDYNAGEGARWPGKTGGEKRPDGKYFEILNSINTNPRFQYIAPNGKWGHIWSVGGGFR